VEPDFSVQKAQATIKVNRNIEKNLPIQAVPKSPFSRKMMIEQGGTQLADCRREALST